jgi:hypothetical protein
LHFKPLAPTLGRLWNHLAAPGFFGYAENGARIEIWRVGAWYSWKVTTASHTTEESAPELPSTLQRYWDDVE